MQSEIKQVFNFRAENKRTQELSWGGQSTTYLPLACSVGKNLRGGARAGDPAPCCPDVTVFPAHLTLWPAVKWPPLLCCVYLGSPAGRQVRAALGEVYSGTKYFRPQRACPFWNTLKEVTFVILTI